jgi:hypothetical protein
LQVRPLFEKGGFFRNHQWERIFGKHYKPCLIKEKLALPMSNQKTIVVIPGVAKILAL